MAQDQLGAPDFGVQVLRQGTDADKGTYDGYWRKWLFLLRQLLTYTQTTATLDFPNTLAQASSELTVSMPGVAAKDFAELSGPAAPVNSCFTIGSVIDDNIVVRFNNYSAAAINPASGSFLIRVWRQ